MSYKGYNGGKLLLHNPIGCECHLRGYKNAPDLGRGDRVVLVSTGGGATSWETSTPGGGQCCARRRMSFGVRFFPMVYLGSRHARDQ